MIRALLLALLLSACAHTPDVIVAGEWSDTLASAGPDDELR